jgi:hypothetical protein
MRVICAALSALFAFAVLAQPAEVVVDYTPAVRSSR